MAFRTTLGMLSRASEKLLQIDEACNIAPNADV